MSEESSNVSDKSSSCLTSGSLPQRFGEAPANDVVGEARAYDAWDYRGGEVVSVGSYYTREEARAAGRLVTRARSVVIAVDAQLHEMERRAITDVVIPGIEKKYYSALAAARTGEDVARTCVEHRPSIERLGDRARLHAWRRAVHRAAEVSPWDHVILRGAIEDLDTHPVGGRP